MAQAPLVLIVDDDQALRDLIREILIDVGYRAVTAANGSIGLATFRSAEPDLVLLDVAMPVMDGLTFLRRRSDEACRPTVPVVVMSAENREREARRLGAQQFVAKPFDVEDILDVVERWLRPVTL